MKKTLTIVVVALCALVFAWGLQYKLSLYQTPTPSAAVPAAKLLVDKSDAAKSSIPPGNSSRLIAILAIWAICLLVRLVDATKLQTYKWSRDKLARFERSLDLACLSRFSSRPPPSLA